MQKHCTERLGDPIIGRVIIDNIQENCESSKNLRHFFFPLAGKDGGKSHLLTWIIILEINSLFSY